MMVRMRDANGQVVGTRAFFPATLQDAVRQKSRWITGIALAGWDRMGWTGSWREIWMRLHDRRGIFSAVVLFAAYLALILEAVVMATTAFGLYEPRPLGSLLATLLPVNGALLCWRLAMRAFFVGRLYGAWEALRSIPRSVVSNIIAILAARRAIFVYVRHWLGHPLRWEKTRHIAPPQEGWMLNGA
jgi:adsorption protein B